MLRQFAESMMTGAGHHDAHALAADAHMPSVAHLDMATSSHDHAHAHIMDFNAASPVSLPTLDSMQMDHGAHGAHSSFLDAGAGASISTTSQAHAHMNDVGSHYAATPSTDVGSFLDMPSSSSSSHAVAHADSHGHDHVAATSFLSQIPPSAYAHMDQAQIDALQARIIRKKMTDAAGYVVIGVFSLVGIGALLKSVGLIDDSSMQQTKQFFMKCKQGLRK